MTCHDPNQEAGMTPTITLSRQPDKWRGGSGDGE